MDTTLKSIELKNFMNHKHFKTDFVTGINSITGDNDKGKSAILTAIGWVYDGKPSGDTVEPWTGEKHTFVKCVFADGLIISRHREKSKNWYEINEQKLESFGNTIPEEVTRALNLSDANFQGQANNLWPMQLTDGQFSKLINQYCNLDDVHATLKRLTSDEKKQREQLELNKTQLKNALEKIETLKWVHEAQGMVESANVIQARINDLIRMHTETSTLLETIEKTALRHSKNKELVTAFLQQFNDAKNKHGEIEKLKEKIRSIQTTISQIKQINTRLQGKESVQTAIIKIKSAKSIISEYESLSAKIESIETKISEIKNTDKKIKMYNKHIAEIKKSITDIRKKLPAICPLCGK